MEPVAISNEEFGRFQQLVAETAGIRLTEGKKVLLCGRLGRRLEQLGVKTYGAYYQLLRSEPAELQVAMDLLTTNETCFFREPRHFEFLRDQVLPARRPGRPFRVWSAACSTGEEPYTIAMVLAEALGEAPWEVIGSDISSRVLQHAQAGRYPKERVKDIPSALLLKYWLKGVRSQQGYLMVGQKLRERVRFQHQNLLHDVSAIGEVDVIFLRNVMIYFDMSTKRVVVARLLRQLQRGGHFLVGHAESLQGICEGMVQCAPAVYRKPGGPQDAAPKENSRPHRG